jgi:ribonuclease R
VSGPSGRRRKPRDTRVVWPPQRRESAREAIEALMRERGLARRFEGAVERAARKAAASGIGDVADRSEGAAARSSEGVADESDGAARGSRAAAGRGPARRDLRELATFTIDPASARDFDDAISAEWIDAGRAVRVWVHIADVSAYVREGSPVDVEARMRATSVYVPGAVEPMLPQALSADACSLVPGRDRLAVTVEMEIELAPARTIAGQATEPSFYRSLIRSDERLDYERVDRIFAGEEAASDPWGEPLRAARAAARVLGEARAARAGALTLDSEEPEFEFDERGEVRAVLARTQTESHRLVEHLMIAANESVARRLERQGAPCLYRVHERPLSESVERLVDQLATLEVPTPPVPEGLSRTQAAELVGEISRRVEEHVLRTAARAREGDPRASPTGGRRALTALVLRALRQAYYTPANLGHAGLGSECYCHFTSPIRRYPDLVCHRALLASLGHSERAPRAGSLQELGEWCSDRERDAMKIERAADDVARCFALERALYEGDAERTFAGEIVGLISAGAFVAFGEERAGSGEPGALGYEGMLPVRVLAAAMAAVTSGRGRVAGEGGPAPAGGARGVAMRPENRGGRSSGGARRDSGRSQGARRDWWELNEEGTILSGERSGAALRLGDPIAVRVERVDAPRGRVDLAPLGAEEPAPTSRSPADLEGASPSATRKGSQPGPARNGSQPGATRKGSSSSAARKRPSRRRAG